jgi:hypothetical protein
LNKQEKGNRKMKAKDALIAWTPNMWPSKWCGATRGKVRIGPLLRDGDVDWTDHPVRYSHTGGAAYGEWREMKPEPLLARLFIEFACITVRDGIDPQEAHRAFLTIDEYRTHIAPDMDGAERPDGTPCTMEDAFS